MKESYVVFTTLFGNYEYLNELAITKKSSTRYICFTDDPKLKSNTWEVVVVKSPIPNSPSRSSRELKILGYKYFPEGTKSLYIDNTVKLKVDGSIILNKWLEDSDVALMHHYSRKTVKGEFYICSIYKLDDPKLIWKQYSYYRKHYNKVLKQKPFWGGMIARVSSNKTHILMETWKQQYDLFAKRDQLSINVSSVISGISVKMIKAENNSSEWHEWPIYSSRNTKMREGVAASPCRKLRIILNGVIYGFKYYLR
jgi:hypothetical protein